MAIPEEVAASFIGCILTIKTKAGGDGFSENIIGTVRSINIDEQTITLDEAMCSGEILPDGFVLKSSQIADLNVCGKAVGNEVLTLIEADFRVSPVVASYSAPVSVALTSLPQDVPKVKAKGTENKAPKLKENTVNKDPIHKSQVAEERTPIPKLGVPKNAVKVTPVPDYNKQLKKGGNGINPQLQMPYGNPPFVKNELREPMKESLPVNAWKTLVSEKQINIKMEPEASEARSIMGQLEASLGISVPSTKVSSAVQTQTNLNADAKPLMGTPITPPNPKDPRVVYVASELERNYFDKAKKIKNEARTTVANVYPRTSQAQILTPIQNVKGQSQLQKFSQVTLHNITPTAVMQKQVELQNTTPTCVLQKFVRSTSSSGTTDTDDNGLTHHLNKLMTTPTKEKVSVDNPFAKLLKRPQAETPTQQSQAECMVDMLMAAKHLTQARVGALSQPRSQGGSAQANQFNQIMNFQKGNVTGAGGRQNGNGIGQYSNGKLPPKHEQTFEMSNAEIFAEEFNFEQNNAMFEKLPVDPNKPVKVQKQPQFCTADTTFLADRTVESIKLSGITATKNFVSDTGIIIPAVDLQTRSKILNMAHIYGLTHSRMVEAMGRSVAQICVSLLGNSFRLSPERENDRPSVLVCTGPHWQGASGICAARTLASQGVKTYVYAKKKELNLCEVEEKLYTLTGQTLTREVIDLVAHKFDLIIFAKDAAVDRDLSLNPIYFKWMANKPVVLIDPPILQSYRGCFDNQVYADPTVGLPTKVCILTPALPLAYGVDSAVKLFLVNMGIPQAIFAENGVIYKSPFGDKLTIQIFSEKQVQLQSSGQSESQ